jgi:N-succinyldiaminopimelate aminotransferase
MISTALKDYTTSIFTEITQKANAAGALNLSQGFPNFEGPTELKNLFVEEINHGWNQYVHSAGIPELRAALAQYYTRHYDLTYSEETDITVTQGATEAILNSITGIFNHGDEIIVFEPFYDAYVPTIKLIGAKPIPLPLHASFAEIQAVITSKTRGMIINFPHNPTGFMPSAERLDELAKIAIDGNLIVISDEVYEHITFDGECHKSIASCQGMKERTVIISSIGKTFSYTGWKVGWAVASTELTKGIHASHQLSTFSTIPASQKAAAAALALPESYFNELQQMYLKKRDFLMDGVASCGFEITKPQGTYFFMARFGNLSDKTPYDFVNELIEKAGVALIPPENFYLSKSNIQHVRFCFSKTDDVLEAAVEKLKRYFL